MVYINVEYLKKNVILTPLSNIYMDSIVNNSLLEERTLTTKDKIYKYTNEDRLDEKGINDIKENESIVLEDKIYFIVHIL